MRRGLVAVLASALVAVSCGEGRVLPPQSASQSCVDPVGTRSHGGATIPWGRLRNPIFSLPDAAAKDVAVRRTW
ncbi:MAG: hypothetical protein LC733_06940 [Actinobacteria bacterium]|nr:hypothetical protein [Actinomycetota bacterium]